MSTADLLDIPESETEALLGSAHTAKRPAPEPAGAPEPAKRTVTDADRLKTLSTRLRTLPTWFPSADGAVWENVTRPGKSKRTLFVLKSSDGGSDKFCMIGRVMAARLSRTALEAPSQFNEVSDTHTDLQVHFSMRSSDVDGWPTFTDDAIKATEQLESIRQRAIKDAMVPLIKADDEKVIGLPSNKVQALRKKTPEKLAEAIDDSWGGTSMNENKDIVRMKRRCYDTTDLNDHAVFMNKWLSVMNSNGEPVNYIEDDTAVERGDLALVWFRALAQITAGNFHVSLEPHSVMVLQKGSDGGGGAGSASFAASLVKAMQRGDQV